MKEYKSNEELIDYLTSKNVIINDNIYTAKHATDNIIDLMRKLPDFLEQ